jgi:hypothetical protein
MQNKKIKMYIKTGMNAHKHARWRADTHCAHSNTSEFKPSRTCVRENACSTGSVVTEYHTHEKVYSKLIRTWEKVYSKLIRTWLARKEGHI